jgi:hypothetical protein
MLYAYQLGKDSKGAFISNIGSSACDHELFDASATISICPYLLAAERQYAV